MFKRKPLPGNTSVVPPSPTSPPPPPPGPGNPPQHLVQSLNNRTIINSSQEWSTVNNEKDDDDSDWWDRSDDEDEVQKSRRPSSPLAVQDSKSGYGERNKTAPGPRSLQPSRRPPIPPGAIQNLGDVGIGGLTVSGTAPSRSPGNAETNPFHRKPSQGRTGQEAENVSNTWAQEIMQSQASQQPAAAPRAVDRVLTEAQPAPPSLDQGDLISFEPEPTPAAPAAPKQSSWRRNFQSVGEKDAVIPEERTETQSNAAPTSFSSPQTANMSQQRNRPEGMPRLQVPPPQPGIRSDVETPQTTVRKQHNKSYQIKHIRWHDSNSSENPRASPILIQNANGPCPLMALVNALVLSTPPTLITALIETLRTRENVSLGLLLDAVIDELMSERRAGGGADIPDVGELYSFLVSLHTGMNVNPRFVPDNSLKNNTRHAGGFEQTREMKLYSTFGMPLVHGWLPKSSDDAYSAFERLAPTFEDCQNMAFREDEFNQKLQSGTQLSDEEESLYIDLTSLKEFLMLWPTQLTEYGLDTIRDTLKPGEVAILFRNDHFSTLYKELRTGQLMTLVTDAGYSTHDEIVWESLADISGSRNELFSGDFRSVSHNPSSEQPFDAIGGDWTTVENKTARKGRAAGKAPVRDTSSSNTAAEVAPAYSSAAQSSSEANPQLPPRPRTHSEQDDHDLALALQLQEEEEQASRAATEARRREDELSERFLSQESSRQGPQIPPRRSNTATPRVSQQASPRVSQQASSGRQTPSSPAVASPASAAPRPPPQTYQEELDLDADGEAPPTYEAAISTAKFNTVDSNSTPTRPSLARPQGSLYSQNSSYYNSTAHLPGSRVGQGAGRRRLSNQQRIVGRGGALGGPRGGGGVGYGGAGGAGRGFATGQTASADDERCSVM